ncbi:MAG TPA: hypothetical protein VFA63_13545 [Pseudonocardiaceae bacterium]|nr:hypothetical protein [Pseudonocardiaceae bacterium]
MSHHPFRGIPVWLAEGAEQRSPVKLVPVVTAPATALALVGEVPR